MDRLRGAIERDDLPTIQGFVEGGGSVNQVVHEEGMPSETMLACACFHDARKVAEHLIEQGADLDKGSCKPIVQAALMGRAEMIRLLLQAGADPNVTVRDPDENVKGLTALFFAVDLPAKIEAVRVLLDGGADPDIVASNGHSALTDAVDHDNEPAVDLLLAAGCKAVKNELLGPVYRGQLGLVKKLIAAGADANVVGTRNTCLTGRTPLEGAVLERSQNYWLFKELTAKGPLDDFDKTKLAEKQANMRMYLEMMQVLIDAGASVNPQTKRGSPLYLAAWENDLEAIELLLRAGADPKQAVDGITGQTAIELARERGFAKVVEAFAAAG